MHRHIHESHSIKHVHEPRVGSRDSRKGERLQVCEEDAFGDWKTGVQLQKRTQDTLGKSRDADMKPAVSHACGGQGCGNSRWENGPDVLRHQVPS